MVVDSLLAGLPKLAFLPHRLHVRYTISNWSKKYSEHIGGCSHILGGDWRLGAIRFGNINVTGLEGDVAVLLLYFCPGSAHREASRKI